MSVTSLCLGEINFGELLGEKNWKKDRCCSICMRRQIREEGVSGQAGTSSGKSRRVLLQRVVAVRPGMPVELLSVLFSQPERGEHAWVP